MSFGVSFLQALYRDVRVNLRRGKASVSEERLHTAEVRATIEHVGGEAVAKFVWADRYRDRRVSQISLQDEPDRARRNSFSRFVNEERSGMHVRRRAIFLDCIECRHADRTNAFLPAFS